VPQFLELLKVFIAEDNTSIPLIYYGFSMKTDLFTMKICVI